MYDAGGDDAKKRWPDRPGWDELAHSMETLAVVCGASAHCDQKNFRLNVELRLKGVSPQHKKALHTLAELVEQVSDVEEHGSQSTVHWVRNVISGHPAKDHSMSVLESYAHHGSMSYGQISPSRLHEILLGDEPDSAERARVGQALLEMPGRSAFDLAAELRMTHDALNTRCLELFGHPLPTP